MDGGSATIPLRCECRVVYLLNRCDSSHDGQGHHDHAGGRPQILHQELLQHNVPQTLIHNVRHLLSQLLVAFLEQRQLHLQ